MKLKPSEHQMHFYTEFYDPWKKFEEFANKIRRHVLTWFQPFNSVVC